MAIPADKLRLTLPADPAKFRLGDLKLFEPGGFSVAGFEAFMLRYSNWTLAELDDLEAGEVTEVFQELRARLEETAVPKASRQRSRPGPAARATPSLAGPGSSPTPKPSE